MERYRSGHNGADSKSVWEQSRAGSNPALSGCMGEQFQMRVFAFGTTSPGNM